MSLRETRSNVTILTFVDFIIIIFVPELSYIFIFYGA